MMPSWWTPPPPPASQELFVERVPSLLAPAWCRLLNHRWDNYPDAIGRTLRLCSRCHRGEVVVDGWAFRLEPAELRAAGIRFG